MRSLFSPQNRQRLSKVLACAILINLNIGWTQILANEISDDTTRAARIDAVAKPAVKPMAKPVVSHLQAKPVAPAAIVQTRPASPKQSQTRPASCSSSSSDCSSSSSSCDSDCRTGNECLESILSKLNCLQQNCGCSSEIDQATEKIIKTLCSKLGEQTTFPSECGDGNQKHNVFDFLRETLKKVCSIDCDNDELEKFISNKLESIIGSKTNFPSDCCGADVVKVKTLFEFAKETLKRLCALEKKSKECAKLECLIGRSLPFPSECCASSSSSDCDSDSSSSDCSSSSSSSCSSSSSDCSECPSSSCSSSSSESCVPCLSSSSSSSDCGCDDSSRALKRTKSCCSSSSSSSSSSDCGCDSSSSDCSDSSSESCLPSLSSSSDSDCRDRSCCSSSSSSSSSSDCGCDSSSSDCSDSSSESCLPSLSSSSDSDCRGFCGGCGGCNSCCSSSSSSDCSSSSSSDCCGSCSDDCSDCCNSSSDDCNVCSSSSSSDCGCSSSSSSSCRTKAKACNSDSDSSSSSDSDSSSACSSDSDCGNGRNVFEFLHEILKRICDLDIEVDCATEEEVRHVVNSKFDCIVGSKTCFPSECGNNCDTQTAKTLFQFLKEILKRLCTLDCATEKQVLNIVCSKVDKAVATLLSKLSTLDCATSEDVDDAVKTICTKLSLLQSTLCSKISNVATEEDVNDLEATLLSKIDEIDCDVDLSCVLSKLSDLHRCLVDEEDSCDSDSICLKNRVRGIQRKVGSILSKVSAIQCRVCEIPTSCCDSVTSIDSIVSSLDECCASLNSKIDTAIECCETVSSKVDVVNVNLTDCCFTLNSKLDVVINGGGSSIDCCDTLNSKLDILLTDSSSSGFCDATPIFGPTTITTAGTYCLATDVVGASPAISINVSDVVLDLNGHKISNAGTVNAVGVHVDTGVNNVVIKNGILSQNPLNIGVGIGIELFAGAESIVLENLFIKSWNVGVSGTDVDKLSIKECQICNNTTNGAFLFGATNVDIEGCLFTGNNENGLYVTGIPAPAALQSSKININNSVFNVNFLNGLLVDQGTEGVHVTNCTFDDNNLNGLSIENARCVDIANSTAKGSPLVEPSSHDGFHFVSTTTLLVSDVLVKNCFACGYENGYRAVNVEGLCISNSTAKGNTVNGFAVTGVSSTGLLQNNSAVNNQNGSVSANGFFYDTLGHVAFYNNVACENDVNYLGVTDAQVTSAANASGGANIDCESTTPNIIESKLDSCCFTLTSKFDQITTGLVITVTALCDLSPVISTIDTCCFTIGSKVDDVLVDLDDCCFTLNSKVDDLNSDLAGCCFTLNSKIGDLCDQVDPALVDIAIDVNTTCTFTMMQWLKAIYQKIQ